MLVRQKHAWGCAAATLAMLIGCSYEEAAAKLRSDPSEFDSDGVGYHVVESQLVNHGYAVSRKWRIFQPGNQQREPWPCEPFADLHWCEVIAGPRGAHAVVMLADGTVLDPMSGEPKRLADYSEVNFVAAVLPVSRASSLHDPLKGKESDNADEPTEAMVEAGIRAWDCNMLGDPKFIVAAIYKAMLSQRKEGGQ